MTPEQKEMTLWGGGAGVLIIAGATWLMMQGGAVADHKRQTDQLYQTYSALYLDETGERQPAENVLAQLNDRLMTQDRELERAASSTVWPGQGGEGVPPEFEGIALGDTVLGTVVQDYASTLDLVSRVTSRLRRRAESLGVDLPATLPLEAQGAISADDASARQLQLVQVCTYAALLDIAMDANITNIGPLQIEASSWRSADGVYAAVPVSTVLRCSYESADALMRELNNNRFGLGIDQIALDYEEDGSFRMALTVRMLVYAMEEWALSERDELSTSAQAGSNSGTGSRRRGGR